MVIGVLLGMLLGVALGLAGGVVVHLQRRGVLQSEARIAEARLADAQGLAVARAAELAQATGTLQELRTEQAHQSAELEHLRRVSGERAAAWEEDRQRLSGAFAELSSQALRQNAEQFLTLADTRLKEAHEAARGDMAQRQQAIDQLVSPLQETLAKYQQGLRQLELDRRGAYDGLTEQVRQIGASHEQLHRETRNLVTALRAPHTRGRWGEMQLRRVVEMAGMLVHCDFDEQVSSDSDDGRLRPDVVVHLPGGAQVVVDAKVPLDAFLHSADADDEDARKVHLASHARQLRAHVDQLAKKQYWQQFDPSPEFVVAFVPGDPLLAAAYEHDPGLVEHAMASRVLLTTPTTLIGLLRTIAFSWQQDALADNAREVQRLGAELYDRLRVMGGHLGKLQRNLSGAVDAFNDTVGSLESRVMVTARKFPELGVVGAGAKELPELSAVQTLPRRPQAADLADDLADDDEVTEGRTARLEALPGGDGQALGPRADDQPVHEFG